MADNDDNITIEDDIDRFDYYNEVEEEDQYDEDEEFTDEEEEEDLDGDGEEEEGEEDDEEGEVNGELLHFLSHSVSFYVFLSVPLCLCLSFLFFNSPSVCLSVCLSKYDFYLCR